MRRYPLRYVFDVALCWAIPPQIIRELNYFCFAGVLGIPPGNGLIPQAPLHVRALATVDYEETPAGQREIYHSVVEKRWSNLFQSIMCLLTLFLFPIIKTIPESVLAGTFLYMGASGYVVLLVLIINRQRSVLDLSLLPCYQVHWKWPL